MIFNYQTFRQIVTYIQGQKAFAFTCNGSIRITAANQAEFDFDSDEPFTYALWLNSANVAGTKIFAIKAETSAPFTGNWMFLSSGTVRVQMFGTSVSESIDVRTNAVQADGTLHHIAITYDGSGLASDITIYVDAHPLLID